MHEAPILLEVLPPAALKNLSATCRSLRASFCARVNIITLPDPADACKLRCATWPQLTSVLSCSGPYLKNSLSPQWEYMMGISVYPGQAAVLIRSREQLHIPLMDVSVQHCAALSDFADKHQQIARSMTLQGPAVSCTVAQTLTHNSWPMLDSLEVDELPQLRPRIISQLSKSFHSLTHVSIRDSRLDAAVLLSLGTGWPQLQSLSLIDNQLDANAISGITQAKCTHLQYLILGYITLGISGVQHLVS